MNYKLLFPTYRNRYLFVRESLEWLGQQGKFGKVLNLGAGEGDYDPMIAPYCDELISCDINEGDIAFARELNKGLTWVRYRVENALDLSFPDNSFDLLISVDVIEHVGDPYKMMEEIQRVLKPGGMALITFPGIDYPFTYDPFNKFFSLFSSKRIAQGAYAFGHEYLISGDEFRKWSARNDLEILSEKKLSGYIVAFLEMYWTGIIQRIFKANPKNLSGNPEKKIALRPSIREPFLVKLTDALIRLDYRLFKNSKYSVGQGFVLKKRPSRPSVPEKNLYISQKTN